MNAAEKERLIARISWGYVSATVNTMEGKLVSLLLRPPTPKEQAQAAIVYETEKQRALIAGLPSEASALTDFIAIGQWTEQNETEIEGLQQDIHTIRKGLLDLLFNVSKLERARSLLRRAENALVERLNRRHLLLQNSAEAHAELCRQRFIIGSITEKENGEPFWSSRKEFEDCSDGGLISQLCEAFFQRSRISISDIRSLARSQQWRAYWEIAKNTGDLFDGSIAAWSLNQRELVYWSTVYDSVYGAYERPSKDIIEDDDLLDSWFIRQGDKIDSQTQNSALSRPTKPGRNEEFIMADAEGAKRVYNMNDPGSRAKIRARQKLLQKQGSIREQDMPDSQREMRQQLTEMQRQHVKSISSR